MKRLQVFNQHGRLSGWLTLFAGFLVTSSVALAAPPGVFGGAVIGGTSIGTTGTTTGTVGTTSVGTGRGVSAAGGHASVGTHSNVIGSQPAYRGSQSIQGIGTPRIGNISAGLGSRTLTPGVGNIGLSRPNVYPAQRFPGVGNLWTPSTTGTRGVGTLPGSRGSIAGSYPYVRGNHNGQSGQSNTGTHLYPGAYGYNSRNYNGDPNVRGRGEDDHHHGEHSHHFHNRFAYSYPYIYSSGYYPYVSNYGDAGDYSIDTGAAYPDASLTPDLDPYDGGSQPDPEPGVVGPNGTILPDTRPVPPASGSQAPAWADQQPQVRPAPSAGPDSLVEAVQDELARRGYYKGKVDAMFRDDTKDAVRRFQKDNHLAVTGLLNNATLKMLGLN